MAAPSNGSFANCYDKRFIDDRQNEQIKSNNFVLFELYQEYFYQKNSLQKKMQYKGSDTKFKYHICI